MKASQIFGIRIAVGTRTELLLAAKRQMARGGAVATVNAQMLDRARRDACFARTLSQMLCIPDGRGVQLLLRLWGVRTEVIAGVELGEALLQRGAMRVGLVGGRAGVAEGAMTHLAMRNPALRFPLVVDGYCRFLPLIREKLPVLDVLYLAIGSPSQELLALRFSREQRGLFAVGLGGSFDVWSGRVRRAPRVFRALGLEWLWRTVREPRRVVRLPSLVRFLFFGVLSHPIAQKRGAKANAVRKTEQI